MEKLYSSKTCMKMAGCIPHISPGSVPARTDNNVSHHTPISRFCFDMMQGKFCPSCFETTARTALAQFGQPPNLPPPFGCATASKHHSSEDQSQWWQAGGDTVPGIIIPVIRTDINNERP